MTSTPRTERLNASELGAYVAVVNASTLIQRSVATQLAEHGLTPLQFSILASLLTSDGGVRMRDLATVLVHSRSGLTYQIAQLEKAGLVAREPTSEDDRGVVAVLTDAGRERVEAAFPGHTALVRANFIDVLGPGGTGALRELLDPVTRALQGGA